MLEKFCEKQNLKGLETSAKNGTNVNEMFELLTKMIIDGKTKEELLIKYNNEGKAKGKNIKKKDQKKKKKKFC